MHFVVNDDHDDDDGGDDGGGGGDGDGLESKLLPAGRDRDCRDEGRL